MIFQPEMLDNNKLVPEKWVVTKKTGCLVTRPDLY
jgi:hypothetical protein